MTKFVKRIAAMGVAVMMMASATAMGASAYNESWSVRQLTYAPTSESCYYRELTRTNSQNTISINCTSVSNEISGSSVLAYISVRSGTMYFTKSGQSCSTRVGKIGISVTSSVKLNCPDSSHDFYYAGYFKG